MNEHDELRKELELARIECYRTFTENPLQEVKAQLGKGVPCLLDYHFIMRAMESAKLKALCIEDETEKEAFLHEISEAVRLVETEAEIFKTDLTEIYRNIIEGRVL